MLLNVGDNRLAYMKSLLLLLLQDDSDDDNDDAFIRGLYGMPIVPFVCSPVSHSTVHLMFVQLVTASYQISKQQF